MSQQDHNRHHRDRPISVDAERVVRRRQFTDVTRAEFVRKLMEEFPNGIKITMVTPQEATERLAFASLFPTEHDPFEGREAFPVDPTVFGSPRNLLCPHAVKINDTCPYCDGLTVDGIEWVN